MTNNLEYEILEVVNPTQGIREKPSAQVGITSFPRSYERGYWKISQLKRFSNKNLFDQYI